MGEASALRDSWMTDDHVLYVRHELTTCTKKKNRDLNACI